MPPRRSLGSVRVESLRNTYLRTRVLANRGVGGQHWLGVIWWEELDFHILMLRLNGVVTEETHFVLSIPAISRAQNSSRRSRR